jgi:2-amino-4-hydroxy-6-hydroxymethyldihydropteridine diphosphokinase
MSTAYLGLGSNVDAETHIRAAVIALRETFENLSLSPIYRTKSVGFDGKDFINLVASVETALQPLQLKLYLNDLEDRYGRKRDVPKFSDRTLDIDILLYGDLHMISPDLKLPRPEILIFSHVLKPLADLAPELVHPVARESMGTLWRNFSGKSTSLLRIESDFLQ